MLDSSTMTTYAHPLDTPIAAAFEGGWAGFAQRKGAASALREDIGQFAVMAGHTERDETDFVSLVEARQKPVILLQGDEIDIPAPLSCVAKARCVQMVPNSCAPFQDCAAHEALGPADGLEMLQLAQLTKPGPFARNTHLLGDFIGIRANGRLVAMVGQRMRFPGWTEISAVCVHPAYRGRGLARGLVIAMMKRIAHRSQRPFLHTYADNLTAIRLYQQLGFEIRAEMNVAMIC